MEVFRSFQEITGCHNSVVALGTFDGVHLGHQKVMRTAIEKARECGGTSVVVTFDAHPFSVLCPEKEPARLSTAEQKIQYIAAVGIDVLVLLPMSWHLLNESPDAFCQQLLTYLHPSAIVVGANFTYGAKAAGNTASLTAFMESYQVPVMVLTLLERPGRATPISSTVIRRLIAMGHMETAEALLGRPYALWGPVVQGDQRGRCIGFPTANMLIPAQMAIPPDGVYVTEVLWQGQRLPAMTNIGANPTFERQYRRIETHIINWKGDIYGEEITLLFRKRIRPEVRFDSVEELIAQMKKDEHIALQFLI